MEEKQKYGLFTSISMVVGIVIGSGIFFKADDILTATGGSVKLGILGFIIIAVGVLFGALVISEYAIRTTTEGGIIAYSEQAFGHNIASVVSWFLITVYFPALIAILAWVVGVYIADFFGLGYNRVFISLAMFVVIACSFSINIFSARLGGFVQRTATVLKLIPLFVIGIVGILFFKAPETVAATSNITANTSFLSALICIAFTFDGWIVVTTISKDVHNPRKTLPKALVIGVLIIFTIYCLYFIGITRIVSPTEILDLSAQNLGDTHTAMAADRIIPVIGGKLVTVFVIISVYGGVNGMTLAYLRLPHALTSKKLVKNIIKDEEKEHNLEFSKGAIKFCVGVVLAYAFLQICIEVLEIPFDLSSMPIIMNYVIYSGLYIFVFKVVGKMNLKIIIYMTVALLVSLLVIYGSFGSNGLLYIIFCSIVTLCGIPFFQKEPKVNKEIGEDSMKQEN